VRWLAFGWGSYVVVPEESEKKWKITKKSKFFQWEFLEIGLRPKKKS
jgi:hypothetical protein